MSRPGNRYGKLYCTYAEAKELAKKHRIQSSFQWRASVKQGILDSCVPLTPESVYREQWKGWREFLGKRQSSGSMLSFEEARAVARKLNVKSFRAWWRAYQAGEIPDNIPSDPPRYYKRSGWTNWSDFLGNGNVANHLKTFVAYGEAKAYAISLNLKSAEEFRDYVAEHGLPQGHPRSPQVVYGEEFKRNGGWRAFLGNEFMTFEEARHYISQFQFRSWIEFRKWACGPGRPRNFPSQPHMTYSKVWVSYPEFLGYGVGEGSNRRDKEEAMRRVRELLQEFPEINLELIEKGATKPRKRTRKKNPG